MKRIRGKANVAPAAKENPAEAGQVWGSFENVGVFPITPLAGRALTQIKRKACNAHFFG